MICQLFVSIINKARNNVENDGRKVDTSLDNGPPSPQLPPTQRRRLSSIKDAKKGQNFIKVFIFIVQNFLILNSYLWQMSIFHMIYI